MKLESTMMRYAMEKINYLLYFLLLIFAEQDIGDEVEPEPLEEENKKINQVYSGENDTFSFVVSYNF